MNPLIITAFTIGGAIAGYFLCALMTAGKVEEITYDHLCQNQTWQFLLDQANAAHSRASDALTTKNQRIERALACVTQNSAHVGKKMARILRGDA